MWETLGQDHPQGPREGFGLQEQQEAVPHV